MRDIRRRVNETRSREERERAEREQREEAANREISEEIRRMFTGESDTDEPVAKRQRGEGHHYGGHYVGAKSGQATASQVSKYKQGSTEREKKLLQAQNLPVVDRDGV